MKKKAEWMWFVVETKLGIIAGTNARTRNGAIECFSEPEIKTRADLRRKFPNYDVRRIWIEYDL